MSYFFEGNEHNHRKYRDKVVRYLRKNKEEHKVIFETDKEFEDYVQNMASDHVWGGELELVALARLYNCRFHVYATGKPVIVVEDQSVENVHFKRGVKKDYRLAYHCEEHYNVITNQSEKQDIELEKLAGN